jgi:hypothetical protein
MGILVNDPHLCLAPSGAAVATFTVAANGHCYDPDTGQWIEEGTTFLPCSIWHHAADNVAQSLTTGTRVLVTGVLRQREPLGRRQVPAVTRPPFASPGGAAPMTAAGRGTNPNPECPATPYADPHRCPEAATLKTSA